MTFRHHCSRYFNWFALLLFVICSACRRQSVEKLYTIDLNGTRSLEAIVASDAPFREGFNVPGTELYSLKDALVEWIFPGGTAIRHHARLVTVDYRAGQLISLRSSGEFMPLEDALVVARKLHVLLKSPADQLDKWEADVRTKRYQADTHMFGARDCNPVIDCEIRCIPGHSIPCALSLSASWLQEKEIKGNPPLPFIAAGLIDLDPPSGKFYRPEDDIESDRNLVEPENDRISNLSLWIGIGLLGLIGIQVLIRQMKRRSNR